ncbi:putative clamp loader subunit DNA polymerase accessory protein [Rhizobium phage RHph_I4]|nr:putative clamp loader subunit DNA polymerase accessory protein [Rhizobium phage RHph_I4]
MSADRLSTPIPDRMKHLPLDRRGYPIPANVFRDKNGDPHFTINDETTRQRLIARDACPICGNGLLRGRWFVGGPGSAFHDHGNYIDTAMHYECLEYALKVCPYLAAPSYAKRIDDKTLKPENAPGIVTGDPTVDPVRPAVFVAVMATGTDFVVHPVIGHVVYVKPRRPYKIVEFWHQGKRIDGTTGLSISAGKVDPAMIAKCFDKKTQVRWDE